MEEINFKEEIASHVIWNVRLRCFLEGGECISEDKIASYRNCCLGRWLYSYGLNKYSNVSCIKELEDIHRNLHRVVRAIVQLKNSGDENSAEGKMGELQALSNRIIHLILEAEREVNILNKNRVLEEKG